MSNDVTEVAEVEGVEEQDYPSAQLTLSDDIDWYLATLVSIANSSPGLSIGVTLTVNGVLISGLLISGKEYFEHLAIELGKNSDNPVSMALSDGMRNISENRYGPNTNEVGRRTAFVHLKNARHYVGGETIPLNGSYWRGKLCDVSGFMLGNMS